MNRKILIALSSALYGASLAAAAFSVEPNNDTASDYQLQTLQPLAEKSTKSFVRSKLSKKIHLEEGLNGRHNYIIRLKDAPVASYRGDIAGFEATSPAYNKSFKERLLIANGKSSAEKRASLKIDVKQPSVMKYSQYLTGQQDEFLSKTRNLLGKPVQPIAQMKMGFNGVVLNLSQDEAAKIASLSSVGYVEREQMYQMETDTGPLLIGADNVWDGTATGVGAMGEGVVIGVIDSGANTDSASFADIGGDGYDHTNPLGAGVYLGDCAGDYPELCNDKLIGVYSYPSVTDNYLDVDVFGPTPPAPNGEDYGGHGSHTASTAGGNVLLNVPMLDREFGEEEGEGINSTGFEFSQISGVAPHANIIAYQICNPGNTGDTYSGCPGAAIVSAIDDAITDGVDVINYSISGGGFPWNSSTELAYLAAQDAGIFVAVSAGNSGPEAFTTVKNAPWYTSVAASTHGRTVEFAKTIGEFSGGDTTAPSAIEGSSATGGITASIVYAGDFDNPNDGVDDDSAQCLAGFPAGTFTGQIVVCDRGAIARVDKAANVFAGGAGGLVLANIQGGATSLNNDVFVIPGIHIGADDGDALKVWLASGAEHAATISGAAGELVIGQADDLAGFSSRGPNLTVPDIMSPSVAAPGVSIYAAYADQHFGHDVNGPAPADFTFLQGTSMASPHVAGAGALLKSAHPTWTPDNIRSALMMTATSDMRKEDGVTTADIFDMGAGRIRVDLAAKTGLLMDETEANYTAANPNEGGDPKSLNIPSMGNVSCQGSCSWVRTFTATVDGDWTTSATVSSDSVAVTVTPASFSILAGESQSITVTATIDGLRTGDQATGVVTLTPADSDVPTANLPLFLTANSSNIPANIDMEVHRDAGSVVLRNNLALEISEFSPRIYGMSKLAKESLTAGQDSDNTTPFDDLADGVTVSWITLAESSKLLYVTISDSESPDLDLFVGIDANGDGIPSADELVCVAATGAANEECQIEEVDAGSYWIMVQNWTSSTPEAADAFNLNTGFVASQSNGNLTLAAQQSVSEFSPFDIRMSWSDEMSEGDVFLAAFDIATDADPENAGNLGTTIVVLTRGDDDVKLAVDNSNPVVGDVVSFTLTMLPNLTDEDIGYSVIANIPEGITIDPDSVTSSGGNATLIDAGIDGANVSWTGTREGVLGQEPVYVTSDNTTDASCVIPNFGQGDAYLDLALFGIGFQPLDGDTVSATYGTDMAFLGTTQTSFTVADDGIVSFGGYGGAPWVNQLLPDSNTPNAVLAPFWRDMQISQADGSGLSVASTSRYTIIEFDDMRHWAFYNGAPTVDDVLDFEVVLDRETGDIMYAYDNVTHNFGDALGQTIGWENAEGTSGDNYIYVGSAGSAIGSVASVTDGLVICHRPLFPTASITVTFSGTVELDAAGSALTSMITNDSTNLGAQEETAYLTVDVQSNLAITDIADNTVAEDETISGIVFEYTDNDAVDNTVSVTSDYGTASNISGDVSGSTFDITPNENFAGTMVVTVTVTDNEKPADSVSTSFEVLVTPVNDAPTVTSTAIQSFNNGVSSISLSSVGTDIDGDDLTYSWTQSAGPSVTISDATSASASVSNANTETGTLTFLVTVSDGNLSATSSVSVEVVKTPDSSSGSGSMAWLLLMLLSTFAIRRRR